MEDWLRFAVCRTDDRLELKGKAEGIEEVYRVDDASPFCCRGIEREPLQDNFCALCLEFIHSELILNGQCSISQHNYHGIGTMYYDPLCNCVDIFAISGGGARDLRC